MAKRTNASKLLKKAVEVMQKAYCPYSGFHVGAVLVDEKGKLHAGCNVENSSYGATICAERSAISALISSGAKQIREVLVVSDAEHGCPPCGVCRQMLSEFAPGGDLSRLNVYLANTEEVLVKYTMAELLPASFGPGYLGR